MICGIDLTKKEPPVIWKTERKEIIMPVDLRRIPKFTVGDAVELNFVGEKLKNLPWDKLFAIYDGLRADQTTEQFNEAVRSVILLIIEAPADELTAYANKAFERPNLLDAYFFTDAEAKCHLFAAFFFNYIGRSGGHFEVGRIDLKTLRVVWN